MKRASRPSPPVSLGGRVAVFTSICVLAAVLLTALVLELRGRAEARSLAQDNLRRARAVAQERLAREGDHLQRLATTVSRDPKFFALLALRPAERSGAFRQALEGVVADFQHDAASEIFDVTDEFGVTLAASARPAAPEENRTSSPLIRAVLAGRTALGYRVEGGRLYQLAVVPVLANGKKVVGTITLGSPVNEKFTDAVRLATGVDVIVVPGSLPDSAAAEQWLGQPMVSTLTNAGTRSVLSTVGRPFKAKNPWTPRDAKAVSIAKTPALAIDTPLEGPTEGGAPRLILAAPTTLEFGVASLRETLLAVGALCALVALAFGFSAGTGIAGRLKRLALAAREAEAGNYNIPLPEAVSDETGILTVDFGAMRESQRQEIERLVELDRMKTGFISVTAQEILAPAQEIDEAAKTISSSDRGTLSPDAQRGLRLIRLNTDHLSSLAQNMSSVTIVSRALGTRLDEAEEVAAPKTYETPEAYAAPEEAGSVDVVTMEADFRPVGVSAPLANLAVPAMDEPAIATPPARRAPLDVAALLEGLAADLVVEGAERGIGVSISVEPELVHPDADGRAVTDKVQEQIRQALAQTAPGGSISLSAQREGNGALMILVEGSDLRREVRL